MELHIAYSPCPNDTYIFDAMVNGKIDTGGFRFIPHLEDVETLNQQAMQHVYDITKISYGVYPLIADHYQILNSGSAIGFGVGPLLISHSPIDNNQLASMTVAIPGENTTAHFLFAHQFPHHQKKVFLRYDQIEQFVLEGKGLGVIIHENRFTYLSKGLFLVSDLGKYWEQHTDSPIPLGGIVVRRSLDDAIKKHIDLLIQKSIEYADHQYPQLSQYTTAHAMEMEEAVMRKHIELYVNDHSKNLEASGKDAIIKMMHYFKLDMADGSRYFV
jgi:1,4-dihydroxy-6-naphthoate synthase